MDIETVDLWYDRTTKRVERTKAAYEWAHDAWIAAGKPTGPMLGAVNAMQHDWEHAERDLVKARVHWRKAHEVVVEDHGSFVVTADRGN